MGTTAQNVDITGGNPGGEVDDTSADRYCLKWNDFEATLGGTFKQIRKNAEFFDVTLAAPAPLPSAVN